MAAFALAQRGLGDDIKGVLVAKASGSHEVLAATLGACAHRCIAKREAYLSAMF